MVLSVRLILLMATTPVCALRANALTDHQVNSAPVSTACLSSVAMRLKGSLLQQRTKSLSSYEVVELNSSVLYVDVGSACTQPILYVNI